jgi:hypothetical protein
MLCIRRADPTFANAVVPGRRRAQRQLSSNHAGAFTLTFPCCWRLAPLCLWSRRFGILLLVRAIDARFEFSVMCS